MSRLTSGALLLSPLDSGAAASQTYSYDAYGNIQSIGGTAARNTPTSSATNRLNGAGMSYDTAGNLTAWNGATYEYDALNQMKRYVSGSEEWLYMYDADDERLWSYKPGVPGVSLRFDRWTLRIRINYFPAKTHEQRIQKKVLEPCSEFANAVFSTVGLEDGPRPINSALRSNRGPH